jgi:hypothetical protein
MKMTTILLKPLSFLLMVLLFKNSFSQTNIINKTLLVPDSNFLYLGITNSIEILNNKNPFFEIRAASRSLTSTRNSYIFELRPTRLGWDTVFILDGNEILFQKAFKIVPLPSIEAKLGTLRVEEATQEEIYINGWLVLLIPNCTCTPSYVVSSFEMEFDSEEIDEPILKIEGDRVTTKARKIIKSLKSGDVVYFDHIKAKNQDGSLIDIPGFSLAVK